MNKKILIEFPDVDIMCSATLLEEEEPELCEIFWNALGKPLKMICQNTLSTGDFFVALPRPPKHPVKVGSQANPIGKKRWPYSRLDPGMLVYSGYAMRVAYGPHITEPLNAPGSVIAKVDEENLDNFLKAGKSVWNAQYMTHRLVTIIFKRKEE